MKVLSELRSQLVNLFESVKMVVKGMHKTPELFNVSGKI